MANNYSEWSEGFADLSAEEAMWLKCALDVPSKEDEAKYAKWREVAPFGDDSWFMEDVDMCDGAGFEYEFCDERDGSVSLWIHSGYGGSDGASELMQMFLQKFRPNDYMVLNVSEHCDRPRIGEFGGVAYVITAQEVFAMSTYDWIRRQISKIEKGKSNA